MLWNLNLFPNNVIEKELNYYLTKQSLRTSLDSRKEYTKSDWIMWTAAMSQIRNPSSSPIPVYKHNLNETVSRVPISDLVSY
ncbi:DUF1793 domain-containing protein [Bacteroides ovatus]|nr:DUF1793 domain-containing protein [Bacteroides ovatus]